MKNTDNTSYVTRPRTKPDESLKGKLNKWSNGYAEFVPQGQKASNRTVLKQLGGSSFYKSSGAKESSWSLHLNVDAKDCADPVGELFEQFKVLTADQRKEMPKMPEGLEGRMLYDNGSSLQVWLDTDAHKVSILTSLVCAPDIERQLLQAQATMNVTLGRYRQEIVNLGTHKL